MSAVLSAYRISRPDLASASLTELIGQATDVGQDYPYSGYVMFNLLNAAEEIGIHLGHDPDADDETFFTFGQSDLSAIERLNLDKLLDTALCDIDLDGEQLRAAAVDSFSWLSGLVRDTPPEEILVLDID